MIKMFYSTILAWTISDGYGAIIIIIIILLTLPLKGAESLYESLTLTLLFS